MSGKMYVVGAISFDYNDENYYPAGDDSAIVPQRVFTSVAEAREWCVNKTMEAINANDYRVGDDLAWDATYTERWRWHFTTKTERCEEFDASTGECCGLCEVDGDYSIEPSGTWDEEFDYRALIEWCIKTNADLWDYLPRIYEVYEVEVGA